MTRLSVFGKDKALLVDAIGESEIRQRRRYNVKSREVVISLDQWQ